VSHNHSLCSYGDEYFELPWINVAGLIAVAEYRGHAVLHCRRTSRVESVDWKYDLNRELVKGYSMENDSRVTYLVPALQASAGKQAVQSICARVMEQSMPLRLSVN